MNNMFSRKIVLTVISLFAVGSVVVYYVTLQTPVAVVQEQAGFSEYQPARDRSDILSMFVTERYWLLSSEDYDPEFMLDYKAPSKDPVYVGKLQIRVLREHGKFVGFTTFYKTTLTEGQILFVAVSKEFRGKGNAQKLAQYAYESLVAMGAKRVWLVTRAENYPAQAAYKKIGFKQFEFDPDGYIYFDKMAPDSKQ